jgi:hypothetical protein
MSEIVISVTDTDLDSILITAIEGGINYWANVRKYSPDGCTAEVRESDQDTAEKPGWHAVDRATVRRGLQVLVTACPRSFAAFLASGTPGDYAPDAGVSDNILQCGIFGSVVYG